MNKIDNRFKLNLDSSINEKAVVQGEKYRFTVLTSQLIRIEYSEDSKFEDRPTQAVWNRNFEVPEFRLIEDDEKLEIITENIHLYYIKGEFKSNTLYADVKGNFSAYHSRWYYGKEANSLKGTCRTLDFTNGEVELEEGIISKNGFSYIDDSKSLVMTEDGWVEPRKADIVDMYFFGYGREYIKAIRDFYKLTGSTPLLPRYALGNWWSRYWKYDEKEYLNLMDRFTKEDIPFSVSVIDMDWHLVDVDEKYGSGWTGYTWNKELFPDPKRFMKALHDKNLKVTLNLHPADGVKGHEEMYEPMAKELGIDYENEHPIEFNITDPKFMQAYFKHLHHPQEQDGVDFWWIDWQQGGITQVEGLDPLWMLNHYHTYDIARNGKRPLIFSRYCGVGSHRYPTGFSGDTYITWDSYELQPYFTATASNIGYGWWSHDIGGHFMGTKDDELSTRWLQFGAFSPIMRLHSSSSIFNGKEPWRYNIQACTTMKEYLRLRHKLIPYTYTMNWRLHNDLVPFIQPMYYNYPNNENAYKVKNQYMFGSELMVCPITSKINPRTKLAGVSAWLPQGRWIDLFDGSVYSGNKNTKLFRTIENYPVLAKEGAIIPMARHIENNNDINNPQNLDILVFPGKSNTFEMYEDNGDNLDYKEGSFVTTSMELKWEDNVCFTVNEACGDLSIVPKYRNIRVMLRGYKDFDNIKVVSGNKSIDFSKSYDKSTNTIEIEVKKHPSNKSLSIIIESNDLIADNSNMLDKIFEMLNKAQIEFELKDKLYDLASKSDNIINTIMEIQCMDIEKDICDAMLELIIR